MIKEQWIHDEDTIANMYFHAPTQVKFLDKSVDCGEEDNIFDCAIGGVAYHNYVICGECGSIIMLEDITDIFVYEEWVDISTEIVGDDL